MPTGDKWTNLQGTPPFNNAGYANLAWQAAAPDSDILYCGDDVRFLQGDTWQLLQEIAYSDPKIGMPEAHASSEQQEMLWQTNPKPEGITYSNQRLALICTYIKREVINTVGYMDPIFGGSYGYDDDDYNYRVRLSGYKLAVTPRVNVEYTSTQLAHSHVTGPGADCRPGDLKFRAKWGDAVVSQIAIDAALDRTPCACPNSNS